MENFYVYLTTNLINGQQYVGDRTCYCKPEKDNYLGSGKYFKRAEKIYGRKNFKKDILEFFPTKQEAFNAQEKYILQFNTLSPNGYNISPKGGNQCRGGISEETKEKIRQSLLGKKHTKERKINQSKAKIGKKQSISCREKISKSLLGHVVLEETKEKIGKANKNKKRTNEFKKHLSILNKGKIVSLDTRKKMSNSHKKVKNEPSS